MTSESSFFFFCNDSKIVKIITNYPLHHSFPNVSHKKTNLIQICLYVSWETLKIQQKMLIISICTDFGAHVFCEVKQFNLI
jgi:hypothetical protein